MRSLLAGKGPASWTKYCPHYPWPRQLEFLMLNDLEALYGGAAAGGKSEALLMAALQYVHVPGYSALILRTDLARLRLSSGLITRAHEWFAGTDAKWNAQATRWSFPTGGAAATISFGYLSNQGDRYRYGSSEYQLIAFDELTEFEEGDYRFLFSRLRRTQGIDVPLRMRAATNPGGIGHAWVKRRFINRTVPECGGRVLRKAKRAFVPARIRDNPAVLEEEYAQSLRNLPALERARLMDGDWSVREDTLVRPEWLRRYELSPQGQRLLLHTEDDRVLAEVPESECVRVVTIDPAGTSRDKAQERRGREASHSVIQVWDLFFQPWAGMALRHTWRERAGFEQLCQAMLETYREWKPAGLWIENEKLGQAAVDLLRRKIPINTIATKGQDKVARAARWIVMLEQGRVFLPKWENGWLHPLEAEWLAWTGHPNDAADQIDPAAYAAQLFGRYDRPGPAVMQGVFW